MHNERSFSDQIKEAEEKKSKGGGKTASRVRFIH